MALTRNLWCIAVLLGIASFNSIAAAAAAQSKPDDTEATFIAGVQQKMLEKYPTAAVAVRAGFFQMTGVDEDATAVYFDHSFRGVDPAHPNFLWFDRHGQLVGLDYEVPVELHPRPPGHSAFPVQPGRWTTVRAHVHFAYRVGGGPVQMRGARVHDNLTGASISAAQLHADGLLPAGARLLWAYYHPTCWDLDFWLIPNPNGPFAQRNPLVR